MSEQLFDIYFRGEVLDGFAIEQTQHNVAQLFKASPEKVQQLFSGKVVALKKGLDKSTAIKFQEALKNAGAKIYIKQAQMPNTTEQVSVAVTTTATNSSTHSADELIILPPGSDVLTEDEREHIEIPDIDISNIHLTSAFDAPTEDNAVITATAPDVSHITAAEVGADILEGVSKEAVKPSPDTSHIHLGNVGEDLLPAKEPVAVVTPDISSIELAEVGADIDPTKKKSPPAAPDTSHIHLDS